MVRLAEPLHAGEDDRDTLRKALDLPLPVALMHLDLPDATSVHVGGAQHSSSPDATSGLDLSSLRLVWVNMRFRDSSAHCVSVVEPPAWFRVEPPCCTGH